MTAEGKSTRRLNLQARRLLLLVSRDVLSEAQKFTAAHLSTGVDDWDLFCDVAARSLGAPLAFRSLSLLAGDNVPQAVLNRLRIVSRMQVLGQLNIEATLLGFQSDCLAPLGVRYAYFKGIQLAHRYYDTPTSRPCRDVDALIEPKAASDVVSRALELGYVPLEDVGPGKWARALWVKRRTVYAMRAPNGTIIEIHRSLDHGDGFFDTQRMLSRAEVMYFRGRALSVLRTSDLFTYICMHHTRHFWSHLHWYADLDAMIRHPLFDPAEVRDVAADAKLASTVDACLELNDYARGGGWPEQLSAEGGPSEALLARSIESLEGGREREDALRASRLSSDRAFAWQVARTERVALFLRKHGNRILFGPFRRLYAGLRASRSRMNRRGKMEG